MPFWWRSCLVLLMAVALTGAFMSHALLAGAPDHGSTTGLVVHGSPVAPTGCAGTSCNKGAPAPAGTPLTIASLWVVLSCALAFAAVGITRRLRSHRVSIPSGALMLLFHPPQFS